MYDADIKIAKIEVPARVSDYFYEKIKKGEVTIEEILSDTLYLEKRRVKDEKFNRRVKSDIVFLKNLNRILNRGTEEEKKDIFEQLVSRYVNEITGHFSKPVYKLATIVLPRAIGLMLNPLSIKKLLEEFPTLPSVESNIHLLGELETLKALYQKATIVMAPTHQSNLDSPIIGLAIYLMDFAPFLYGAGLNLFENPIFSFFMHNLGAYTVDRKKKNEVYLYTLKTYATFALERGYNMLFFPGGTRSRSGAVEKKLKRGLLGTSLKAYINNILMEKEKPDIFVVPLNMSYQLVLEAETLIDDFLRESGKSRYIIEDDESSQAEKIALFISKLFSLDSQIYLRVGRPIDVFGNYVDENGISYDPKGRRVDRIDYIIEKGEVVLDDQRDKVYTDELSSTILKEFKRNNIILTNHLTSFAAFELFLRYHADMDLYKLVKIGVTYKGIPIKDLASVVEKVKQRLVELHERNEIFLSPEVLESNALDIINDALRYGSIYHKKAFLYRVGDKIYSDDLAVLFYYHNRLDGYELEKLI